MKTKTTLAALLLAAVMVTPSYSAENRQNSSPQGPKQMGFWAGNADGRHFGRIGEQLSAKQDLIGMGRTAALRNNIPQQYRSIYIDAYSVGFRIGYAAAMY